MDKLDSDRRGTSFKAGRPIVYISYRWIDAADQGRPARAPDPCARELAGKLREHGVDVRLDIYFLHGMHGFKPPERVAGDPRDPWLVWAERQIVEADAVLMLCTPEYADTDPDHGESPGVWSNWCQQDESVRIQTRVPALWWDWLAIAHECNERPQKYIPIGWGRYHSDQIPAFLRGASYLNLSDDGAFDALLRRIRQVWRARVPRRGVFVSYAHKDDQSWLDSLLGHLDWLKRQHDVELWTDRDIEPGEGWHETIQSALDSAKVGILLVSPEFLASAYITSNELPRMLDAAESDGLKIFWIPVRPSAYKPSPIAKFQAAHAPDRPLSRLRGGERDQALVEIGEKLAKSLDLTPA
jgi:TIR domain